MLKACEVHDKVVAVEKYAADNQISKEDAARIMAEGASASKTFARDKKKLEKAAEVAADASSPAAALASAMLGGSGVAMSGGGSSADAAAHNLRARGSKPPIYVEDEAADDGDEEEEESAAAAATEGGSSKEGKRARKSVPAPGLRRQMSTRTVSAVEELREHLRSEEGADAVAAYVAAMEHERLVKLLKALALPDEEQ